MMAAARLVSDGGGELEGEKEEDVGLASGGKASRAGSAKAVEEAIAFLEEVETRQDGGVGAWMLPGVTVGVGVR